MLGDFWKSWCSKRWWTFLASLPSQCSTGLCQAFLTSCLPVIQNIAGRNTNKSVSQPASQTANPFWESLWWSMNKEVHHYAHLLGNLNHLYEHSFTLLIASFFINRTMSSSSSRSLKQLSSNPRGLAFLLGPKLAASSPLKPIKDFPADHCCSVLYIVEGFVLSFGHSSVQIE